MDIELRYTLSEHIKDLGKVRANTPVENDDQSSRKSSVEPSNDGAQETSNLSVLANPYRYFICDHCEVTRVRRNPKVLPHPANVHRQNARRRLRPLEGAKTV